jgi:antitoxin HigA-1
VLSKDFANDPETESGAMIGQRSASPPTHPGEMLRREFVRPLGLTQEGLADRLGISFRRVNEVLNEKRGVTLDTALRLERLFGREARYWMELQLAWDLWHARRGELGRTAEREVEPLRPLASPRNTGERKSAAEPVSE